jgi:hypothetical protein
MCSCVRRCAVYGHLLQFMFTLWVAVPSSVITPLMGVLLVVCNVRYAAWSVSASAVLSYCATMASSLGFAGLQLQPGYVRRHTHRACSLSEKGAVFLCPGHS